jgi:fructose-bisphosphate aldolase class I
MNLSVLKSTLNDLIVPGKGILAADESDNTIRKRLASIGVESTEKTRKAYRELLFTTPNLERYISGTILFDETLRQKSHEQVPFPEILEKRGIVPGIKVDKGLIALENSPHEKVTQGLDGLGERLEAYKELGARFAKWRVVFSISTIEGYPSQLAIKTNAFLLARYAAICQNHDIVPIVEPEVLMDGNHTLETCATLSQNVFHQVFHALHQQHVSLEFMLLKPNLIVAGKTCDPKPSIEDMAKATIIVLRRTVPVAVPSINFLSGGLSAETATVLLNRINQLGPHPWKVSFSYGRALQAPALKAWQGKATQIKKAQTELLKRAQLNSAAVKGEYKGE